ncbi:MAG: DUF6268 family outer membrane beta-barrel protein [Phycisphaerales bacterium]
MLTSSRFVVALGALSLATPAIAQDAMEPDLAAIDAPEDERPIPEQPESAPWRWSLDLYGRHGFDADLETAGEVGTTRFGTIIGVGGQLDERSFLRVNLRIEASSYDFSNADAFGAGPDGPLDEGYDISLRPIFVRQVNQEWGWLVSPFLRFSGERDVSLGEAIQYGGFVGVSRRFNENFSLTLGGGAQTRFEDDPLVIPYIAFEWTPSETLSVESDGLGVTATRALTEAWSARLFARWEPRDYRLADDGPIPDGVMRDDEVLMGLSLIWAPSRRSSLDLTLGATVYRQIETLDDSGDTLRREEVDPAPFVSARFTWAF